MTIAEYTHALGEATGHGWGFLAAYGATWVVCAIFWRRASPRTAAYVTLFQGMVALPVALALTAVTPGPSRPALEGMDSLSVLLSAGQALALPLIIALVVTKRHTLVPPAMVIVTVVHFAPYSWLYATPLYLVMGAVLAVGATVAMGVVGRGSDVEDSVTVAQAQVASLVAGMVLIGSAIVAWFL